MMSKQIIVKLTLIIIITMLLCPCRTAYADEEGYEKEIGMVMQELQEEEFSVEELYDNIKNLEIKIEIEDTGTEKEPFITSVKNGLIVTIKNTVSYLLSFLYKNRIYLFIIVGLLVILKITDNQKRGD